jgi:uncharacterized protein DUF6152
MRKHVLAVLILAALLAVSSAVPVQAHHSAAALYDLARTVSVQGVVTEFRFVNPHAMMLLDVTDDSGKAAKWTVELSGRLNLSEGGWNEHTIVIGQRVTVTGNPTRVDAPRVLFIKMVRPDGTELVTTGADRLNEVERARQDRARQRDQQK